MRPQHTRGRPRGRIRVVRRHIRAATGQIPLRHIRRHILVEPTKPGTRPVGGPLWKTSPRVRVRVRRQATRIAVLPRVAHPRLATNTIADQIDPPLPHRRHTRGHVVVNPVVEQRPDRIELRRRPRHPRTRAPRRSRIPPGRGDRPQIQHRRRTIPRRRILLRQLPHVHIPVRARRRVENLRRHRRQPLMTPERR